MSLAFKPIHPLFAAEMSGLDLRQPMSPDTVAEIDTAMDRHAVLLVRGQALTPEEQLAFTRQFGPLDIGFARVAAKRRGSTRVPGYMANMTNLGEDGKVVERDNGRILGNIANQLWHSDSSFQQPPAKYSMLYSVTNPSWGGETEFADMRAAYDSLDARTKAEVEGLVSEHWALHSRFMLGDGDYTQEAMEAIPPVEWPVVRIHPGSGRKLLFIGAHARRILGMSVPEGRKLLMDLLEHATQPQHVYRHEWRVGDLIIWDNRSTLHRGLRFDLSEPRQLRRTTTLDAAEPLKQVA